MSAESADRLAWCVLGAFGAGGGFATRTPNSAVSVIEQGRARSDDDLTRQAGAESQESQPCGFTCEFWVGDGGRGTDRIECD
ncbi:MAG: hypothetical protein ACT4QG_13540 [Sporichthyaceae bacterium]